MVKCFLQIVPTVQYLQGLLLWMIFSMLWFNQENLTLVRKFLIHICTGPKPFWHMMVSINTNDFLNAFFKWLKFQLKKYTQNILKSFANIWFSLIFYSFYLLDLNFQMWDTVRTFLLSRIWKNLWTSSQYCMFVCFEIQY